MSKFSKAVVEHGGVVNLQFSKGCGECWEIVNGRSNFVRKTLYCDHLYLPIFFLTRSKNSVQPGTQILQCCWCPKTILGDKKKILKNYLTSIVSAGFKSDIIQD